MKKYIMAILATLIVSLGVAQVSSDKNYVHYHSYNEAVQVANENGSEKKSQSVHYLDGRGKVIQEIAIKAGSASEDIIQGYQFDALDREKREFLAYAKTSNNGGYRSDFRSELNIFYNTAAYDNTTYPFAEIAFDDKRPTAPKEISHPGNSEWNLVSGHTKKIVQSLNVASDAVKRYHPEYTTEGDPVLLYDGGYDNNTLYKTTYRNENWISSDGNNNTSQEFKDFLGRKILTRNFNAGIPIDTYYVYDNQDNVLFIIPANVLHDELFDGDLQLSYKSKYPNLTRQCDLSTADAQDFVNTPGTGLVTAKIVDDFLTVTFDGTFPVNTTISFMHQTFPINTTPPLPYIVLGDLDCGPGLPNLAKVAIANNGLELKQNYSYSYITSFKETFTKRLNGVVANQSFVDSFMYQYKYDHKNRLIGKKLPGIGWEYYVYDKYNRVVASQTAVQKETAKWSVTAFDALGRQAYTGSVQNLTLAQLQSHFNTATPYVTRTANSQSMNGSVIYYTHNFPQVPSLREILYYDDYAFDLAGITLPSSSAYGDNLTTSAKGLVTAIKSRPSDDSSFITTVNRYDAKDRLVQYLSSNPLLQTMDIVDSKLDFVGNVLEKKSNHTKTGVVTNLITYDYYTYDHENRLIKQAQKIAGNPTEVINQIKYDALGNAQSKKVGHGAAQATISGLSNSTGVYTKTAAASWANASISTTSALIGNGNMSFRIGNSTDNQLNIGVSYSPTTTSYTQINYAYNFTNTAHASGGKTVLVVENGITKSTSNYFAFDEFSIERVGTVVNYKKNNLIIYQSSVAATIQNLYGDAHFYSTGSTISNLRINNDGFDNAISLQNTAYKFNVRGGLAKINDVSGAGTGLFNMQIRYNDAASGPKFYNGNISQIQWRTQNDPVNVTRSYDYNYDHLHRMTIAKYKQSNLTSTGQYNEEATYSALGNIITLKRYGTSATTPVLIDDLSYSYWGHTLNSVSDASNNIEGFNNNGINSYYEFTYDSSGNIKTDLHKQITNIVYNELNLPTKVTFSGTNKYIDLVYDSQGNKLSKKVVNGTNITLTEYAGIYTYVKLGSNPAELEYINHPEGYVNYNSGNINYVYHCQDHLGNIRLTFTDYDKNGIPEIIEENNYYAFGLKHKGYNNVANTVIGNPNFKLSFQGQEMNDDLGLNWLSFKWRNYDPALGRFFSVDPLAEKYAQMTTYQFSSNQPIHAPELEGMESAYPIGDNLDFSGDWNAFGQDLLDEFGNQVITPEMMITEVAIEGKTRDKGNFYDDFDMEDAADIASYLPGGGVVDMYRGARDGDWVQFAMGTVSLGLDVFTLGSASVVKGATMAGLKQGAKALAKEAAKEVAEEGLETIAKQEGKNFIYSSRELIRRSDASTAHNFPDIFDDIILKQENVVGTKLNHFEKVPRPNLTTDSKLYRIEGSVLNKKKGGMVPGHFEIATRPSLSGRTEVIIHRQFKAAKKIKK